MSISATVDGTTYNGIETITGGGKSIALAESGGGSSSIDTTNIKAFLYTYSGSTIKGANTALTIPNPYGAVPTSVGILNMTKSDRYNSTIIANTVAGYYLVGQWTGEVGFANGGGITSGITTEGAVIYATASNIVLTSTSPLSNAFPIASDGDVFLVILYFAS